ncbi:hypothetical protein ACFLXC_00810 [Chloroflexota bacterium]
MPDIIKALCLLSSGMDSALAVKVLMEQGIEVVGLNFVLPFADEKADYAGHMAEQIGISLIRVQAGDEYIDMVRHPVYGYGSYMNPCVDCRIYMLRGAKRVAQNIGARFIATGEVLEERPKSQGMNSLMIVERASGLRNKVVRPLTAGNMPVTIPERQGLVDRARLLSIKGRSRKPQMELLGKYNIQGSRTPSGGCLLTREDYCHKLKALFKHKKKVTLRDIELLKIGRHFYLADSVIIVGRNERDNNLLRDLRGQDDFLLEMPGQPAPTTLMSGDKQDSVVNVAARLTVKYCGVQGGKVVVECNRHGWTDKIEIEADSPLSELEGIFY